MRSLSQNFDDDPFLPLSVPLAIKHALPRPEIQLPGSNRHDHFMADGQAAKVGGRVVLTRLVVAIAGGSHGAIVPSNHFRMSSHNPDS